MIQIKQEKIDKLVKEIKRIKQDNEKHLEKLYLRDLKENCAKINDIDDFIKIVKIYE